MMESFTFGRIENQRRLERRDIAKGEAAGVEPFLSLFPIFTTLFIVNPTNLSETLSVRLILFFLKRFKLIKSRYHQQC